MSEHESGRHFVYCKDCCHYYKPVFPPVRGRGEDSCAARERNYFSPTGKNVSPKNKNKNNHCLDYEELTK